MSIVGLLTTSVWNGCAPGVGIKYVLIEGGTHQYPLASNGAPIDAPTATWAFFLEHPQAR